MIYILRNVPNMLSIGRLLSAPLLLLLALLQLEQAFLLLLLFAFISDVLDGAIARHFKITSELGAQLDSWADVLIYLAFTLSTLWLWPEVVLEQKTYITIFIVSLLLPTITGILKFGNLTSYHTWLVKIAVVAMAVGSLLLFTGGPDWLFRIASILCMLAGIEETLITLYLKEKRSNVRSLLHITKISRRDAETLGKKPRF
jgi:phosphatidylglycerophosphate synthase